MNGQITRRIRVVHLITDLDIGGAEMMLARLVRSIDTSAVENIVVSLTEGGMLIDDISNSGVRVIPLGLQPGRLNIVGLYRTVRLIRRLEPDILQTWLYHADFAGLVAGNLAGVPTLVWNIRCATLDPRDHPVLLRVLRRLLALMSGRPAVVVSNSEAGVRAHQQLGYHPRRWVVIPNGFDTDLFKPDVAARREFRRELGIDESAPLVGLLARLHPMKDHATFLEAAAKVAASRPLAQFVIAGRGVRESTEVRDLITRLGIEGRIHLLPDRRDPPKILAALDVAVSSSYSESFPNVVGEAMSCGTPPVVTATGDSAVLVGDVGRVVPPRQPTALAAAILALLDLSATERIALGRAARERIVREYSLPKAASRYQQLYEELSPPPVGIGTVAERHISGMSSR
jgi:glycosyltransferase involved in cell wall biosynthesis